MVCMWWKGPPCMLSSQTQLLWWKRKTTQVDSRNSLKHDPVSGHWEWNIWVHLSDIWCAPGNCVGTHFCSGLHNWPNRTCTPQISQVVCKQLYLADYGYHVTVWLPKTTGQHRQHHIVGKTMADAVRCVNMWNDYIPTSKPHTSLTTHSMKQ